MQIKKSSEQAKKTEKQNKENRAQSKENCDIFIFNMWCDLRFLGSFLSGLRIGVVVNFFFFFWAKAFKEINRKLSSRANGYSHVCWCWGEVVPLGDGVRHVPFTYRPPHDK